MPRANRHYLPGNIWHLTHRCHKKEFLLKFGRDREEWISWLFEARKRYGLSVLNYMVTSNHIHLMTTDDGERETIPKSLQLVAGRVGQQYNQRKKRKGAYWEDRYHATAIESGEHLRRCMNYIDMNMVRAGVVDHPGEWPWCGYKEIQNPKKRHSVINYERLIELFGAKDLIRLQEGRRGSIEEVLRCKELARDSRWTESIAVGGEEFVSRVKEELGVKAKGRKQYGEEDQYELREEAEGYLVNFGVKNGHLRPKNAHYLDLSAE